MKAGLIDRTMAACAHLGALLPASLGLIMVGLMMIVLLPRAETGSHLRDQLAQAFAYQALVAVLSLVVIIVFLIPGSLAGLEELSRIYVVLAIYVATAAYAMYGAHQSFHGYRFRYAVVGGVASRLVQSAGGNGSPHGEGPADDDRSSDGRNGARERKGTREEFKKRQTGRRRSRPKQGS